MPIAQRRVAHVCELDIALRARVHEHVALRRVELGCRDDLCELLHIHRLDVNDIYFTQSQSASAHSHPRSRSRSFSPSRSSPSPTPHETKRETRTEAPVANIQVPKVDPQVVCRDVRLLVRVDRDRVDVVCVCVRVYLARDGRDDVVLLLHARQAEVRG